METSVPARAPGPSAPEPEPFHVERVLCDRSGAEPGPLFLAVGGIHGNERAGVLAIQRVCAHLEENEMPVRGRLVALAGNRTALERGVRYLESDLNRMWKESEVEALWAQVPELDGPEQAEQRELLRLIGAAVNEHGGAVVLLDLHSSSAPGEPFVCMGDTLQNREIAADLPAPVILGLEENIDGALLEYFSSRGHAALAIEGGQHEDPRTVEHHEAALWITLVAAGVVDEALVPDLEGHRDRLRRACRGLPRVVEIRHRHGTVEGDGFVMEPGYVNFQRVAHGDRLARDLRGEIRATENGRILLPRYQGQGDDGFFLVRRVLPVWMQLSLGLRKLRLGFFLRFLPGVSKHPNLPESLRVDSRVARWRVIEIFHLFGYRRQRPEGRFYVFTRRTQRRVH